MINSIFRSIPDIVIFHLNLYLLCIFSMALIDDVFDSNVDAMLVLIYMYFGRYNSLEEIHKSFWLQYAMCQFQMEIFLKDRSLMVVRKWVHHDFQHNIYRNIVIQVLLSMDQLHNVINIKLFFDLIKIDVWELIKIDRKKYLN